jgi:hypothetical protein
LRQCASRGRSISECRAKPRVDPAHEAWCAVWSSLVVDRFLLSVPHGERTQALEHLGEGRRNVPSQKKRLGYFSTRFELDDGIAITRFSVLAADLRHDVQQLRPREPRTLGMTLACFYDLRVGAENLRVDRRQAAGGLSLVFLVSASVVACTAAFGALAIRSRWSLHLDAESQMRSSLTRARA